MKNWSANQLVAYNLRRVRKLRHMTQKEAGKELGQLTGEEWSTATWSSAEQSVKGKRIRQFGVRDLLVFALLFDVPLAYFFTLPSEFRVSLVAHDPGTKSRVKLPLQTVGRLAETKTYLDRPALTAIKTTLDALLYQGSPSPR